MISALHADNLTRFIAETSSARGEFTFDQFGGYIVSSLYFTNSKHSKMFGWFNLKLRGPLLEAQDPDLSPVSSGCRILSATLRRNS